MREFASPATRAAALPRPVKALYTAFCALTAAGLLSCIGLYDGVVRFGVRTTPAELYGHLVSYYQPAADGPAAPSREAAPAPRTRPIPPPGNETAPSPIVKVGEIRIPRIGLVHPIYEGVTLTVIDHGPGHWPGSALPGQLGNAVFAGHRVTHTHPFRNIDKLVPGDEIQFVMPDGTYTYRMTAQQIVSPADTWIVNPTPTATLTLFACHPPGSATKRIVIRAEYVGRS